MERRKVVIVGSTGGLFSEAVKIIDDLKDDSIEVIIDSTGNDDVEEYKRLLDEQHNISSEDLIELGIYKRDDYCYDYEEKEPFFLKNHIVKNKHIFKNHRIQIRNNLPQRIRVNEKAEL